MLPEAQSQNTPEIFTIDISDKSTDARFKPSIKLIDHSQREGDGCDSPEVECTRQDGSLVVQLEPGTEINANRILEILGVTANGVNFNKLGVSGRYCDLKDTSDTCLKGRIVIPLTEQGTVTFAELFSEKAVGVEELEAALNNSPVQRRGGEQAVPSQAPVPTKVSLHTMEPIVKIEMTATVEPVTGPIVKENKKTDTNTVNVGAKVESDSSSSDKGQTPWWLLPLGSMGAGVLAWLTSRDEGKKKSGLSSCNRGSSNVSISRRERGYEPIQVTQGKDPKSNNNLDGEGVIRMSGFVQVPDHNFADASDEARRAWERGVSDEVVVDLRNGKALVFGEVERVEKPAFASYNEGAEKGYLDEYHPNNPTVMRQVEIGIRKTRGLFFARVIPKNWDGTQGSAWINQPEPTKTLEEMLQKLRTELWFVPKK